MRRDYGCVYNYKAVTSGGIGKYLLVKFGTNDGEVDAATAATDKIIGVTTDIAADQNQRCDVVRSGLAPVVYGGTVAKGDLLTADSSSRAVVAAPAAGANVRIIGTAEVAGVVGDIGSMFVAPSMMQGA